MTDKPRSLLDASNHTDDVSRSNTCTSPVFKIAKLPKLPQRVVHYVPKQPPIEELPISLPSSDMNNIVWAPFHVMPQTSTMQNRMISQNSMLTQAPIIPQVPMSGASQNLAIDNQTEDRIIVQTCKMSLSKRFTQYLKNTNPTNDNRNCGDRNQLFGSLESLNLNESKSILGSRHTQYNRTYTVSESNGHDTKCIGKSNSLESLLNDDCLKSTFAQKYSAARPQTRRYSIPISNTVESCKASENEDDQLESLDSNDLRFLLVAKRRKLDAGKIQGDSEGKKINTYQCIQPPLKAKKRITFDLGLGEDSSLASVTDIDENPPYDFDIASLDGLTYIVSDFETLLGDFKCIEEYVQADDKRRLLIPHDLKASVEALSRCRDTGGVPAARHLTRRITDRHPGYVILPESEKEEENPAIKNKTLNSCLDILNSEDDMIVITNNPELYNEAKSLNIKCFDAKQIKDGAGYAKPKLTFDVKKIKLPADNGNKPVNEKCVTAISTNEFPPYSITGTAQIPINISNRQSSDKNRAQIKSNLEKFNNNTLKTSNSEQKSIFDIESDTDRQNESSTDYKQKIVYDPTPVNARESYEMENIAVRFENRTSQSKLREITDNSVNVSSVNEVMVNNVTFTQHNKEKSDGEILVDSWLKVYLVKSKDTAKYIMLRMEEFICTLTQIMENALTDFLMRRFPIADTLTTPWVLYESTMKIQQLYGSNKVLKLITDKFKEMLEMYNIDFRRIDPTIKPNVFMRILGCANILLGILKNMHPAYLELREGELALKDLVYDVTSGAEPEVPEPVEPEPSPSGEDTRESRRNFMKTSSDIVEYLKKHYPDWSSLKPNQDHGFNTRMVRDDTKVIRTVGRNSIILNKNTISVVKNDENRDNCNNTAANSDLTNDSGYQNESLQAYFCVKGFLSELCGTLKSTYQFITDTVKEYRCDTTKEKRKLFLHNKTTTAQKIIAAIIDQLKSIIERETKDSTLKEMLVSAGEPASSDKRMINYRQMVTKCLEQALVLDSALRRLSGLDEPASPFYSMTKNHPERYFNVFE